MPSQPSNAGIVTDDTSGERHIPESKRPDGSTRRAIKIKPGYRPPEDVELYKNRTAEAFRERGKRIGIPGAAGLKDDDDSKAEGSAGAATATAASNKNAKRREARKKAKAAAEETKPDTDKNDSNDKAPPAAEKQEEQQKKSDEVDTEVEKLKKARNLKKKLKQAKDLRNKKEEGEALLPEQIAKVIKINELIRELDALGFDSEGDPRDAAETKDAKDAKS